MRFSKPCSLVLTLAVCFSMGAATAQEPPDSVTRMTNAARTFLESLTGEQRETATFEFDNAKEREGFRPVPFPTTGLRFDAMNESQIALVHDLLRAGLSAAGYEKAASIIELEDYLVEIENTRGRAPRFHGSQNYNVAIFGEPSNEGAWSWRFHGHHAYLSFTIVDGELFSTAPAFFGAEPHDVTEGPRAPWRVLADEEDLGSDLFSSLSAAQQTRATISEDLPRDMFSGNKNRVEPGAPEGIPYSELTQEQQAQLRALVMEYVHNSPEDLQHKRIEQVESGGWDTIYFGWIGDPERGERNYYRVQGPEFLIEYCAVALTSNHVHTVWRDYDGDFGRDILAEHYNQNVH